MEKLSREDIKHNIAIIKINKSYSESMSALELYDITRGCWKRRLVFRTTFRLLPMNL